MFFPVFFFFFFFVVSGTVVGITVVVSGTAVVSNIVFSGTVVLNCVLFSIAILNILSVNPYATNKIINILANIIITIIGILYFLSVLFSSCFTGFSDSLFIVLVPDASPT